MSSLDYVLKQIESRRKPELLKRTETVSSIQSSIATNLSRLLVSTNIPSLGPPDPTVTKKEILVMTKLTMNLSSPPFAKPASRIAIGTEATRHDLFLRIAHKPPKRPLHSYLICSTNKVSVSALVPSATEAIPLSVKNQCDRLGLSASVVSLPNSHQSINSRTCMSWQLLLISSLWNTSK